MRPPLASPHDRFSETQRSSEPAARDALVVSSTVASLLAAVGLEPTGCVAWGAPIPDTSTGVYVVALSPSAHTMDGLCPEAPVSDGALEELFAVCPALALDRTQHPAKAQLAKRIGCYWLSDETVLYIGLAGQPLRTRVRQYDNTPLGAAKPTRGRLVAQNAVSAR